MTCTQWNLSCFIAGLSTAAKLYGPLFLVTTILQAKFRPKLTEIVSRTLPAILRSSIFLGVNGSLFPTLVCLWAQVGNHSRLSYFLNALISSWLAILIEKPSRRSELAVYMGQQATESLYFMGVSRGLLPTFTRGLDVLYMLSFATLVLFSKHLPELLPGSAKFLLAVFVGEEKKPDVAERLSIRAYDQFRDLAGPHVPALFSKGAEEKTRICKHGSGCKTHAVVGLIKAFFTAVLVRAIFQVPSALIAKGPIKFLRALPRILLKLVTGNSLRFALFFAFMSGGTRAATCFLRWLRGIDDWLNSFLGGLAGSLSVLLFSSADFAMYIVSKAAEALCMLAFDRNVLVPLPHGEVILYSVATAINFYCAMYEPHNLRQSYWAWLMKMSKGLWAHSHLGFVPAREEAGIHDLPRYRLWDAEVAGKIVRKFVTPEQFDKLYREHLNGFILNY